MRYSIVFLALLAVAAARTIGLQKIPTSYFTEKRDSDSTIALGGGIAQTGSFFASIQLGSPPQNLNVQVDTGSSDLLVFGLLCKNCDSNVTYAAINSDTYGVVPCNYNGYTCHSCADFRGHEACSFSDYYGDGSGVNGSVLTDYMNVASFSKVNVSFGYINSSSKGFETAPIDGIWGISYPDLAMTSTPPLYSIFQQDNVYKGFSMCLQAPDNNIPATMTFGKPTDTSGFQYTPIVKQQYYNVDLSDFAVAGTSLGLPASAYNNPFSIVDSGTTLALFPPTVVEAIYSAMFNMCSTTNLVGVCGLSYANSIFNGSNCPVMTQDEVSAYPVLSVSFNGVSGQEMHPSNYLIIEEQNGQTYGCMGIASSGNVGGTILGDTFMQGRNVFFDIANSQIGFADESTCPSNEVIMA